MIRALAKPPAYLDAGEPQPVLHVLRELLVHQLSSLLAVSALRAQPHQQHPHVQGEQHVLLRKAGIQLQRCSSRVLLSLPA